MNYTISVNLTNIEGARLTEDEDVYTGKLQKGVFIPIQNQENGVYEYTGNRAALNLFATKIFAKGKGMSHILKPLYGPEKMAKLKEENYESVKYIGKMRPSFK